VKIGLPLHFELGQNFPNPFNPKTTIIFTVPEKSENTLIQLQIFNHLGEKIKLLVDEEKEPGQYKVSFEGDNLPSGIYYYRMIAGEFTQTKKMILLR